MAEEPVKDGPSYEAFALYDVVRIAIFNDYTKALDILDYINKQDAGGYRLQKTDNKVMEFKAIVMRLYHHLRDKITYPKHPEPFKPLYELENYARRYTTLKRMSIEDACTFFLLERMLIETLGITRFEKISTDPTNWPAQKVGL